MLWLLSENIRASNGVLSRTLSIIVRKRVTWCNSCSNNSEENNIYPVPVPAWHFNHRAHTHEPVDMNDGSSLYVPHLILPRPSSTQLQVPTVNLFFGPLAWYLNPPTFNFPHSPMTHISMCLFPSSTSRPPLAGQSALVLPPHTQFPQLAPWKNCQLDKSQALPKEVAGNQS